MQRPILPFKILSVFCLTLLTSACISYTSNQENLSSDIPSLSHLEDIQLGQTKSDWLLQEFGQPTVITQPTAGTTVWHYENLRRSTTKLRALPIFSLKIKDIKRTVYNFEIEDDYIVRYWKETEDS